MLNSEFICVIGTVPTYLGKWGKRVNFSNDVVEIQQKYERERENVGEGKFWISVMWLPKFLLPELAARVCDVLKKETNCGNAIAKIREEKKIVAITLPKMGGEKKIVVAEIWGGIKKKKNVTSTIFSQQITSD